MPRVLTGLDRVLRDGLSLPGKGRAALLCNATTVSSAWIPTAEALAHIAGIRVERVFSPQHGFAAEKQDNMIASADGVHPRLKVPIVSLYGERREPRAEDFTGVDALLIDLPDVGTRVYTFLVSAILAMKVAARCGLPVFVLDRANPIGRGAEGPVLEDDLHSFVGVTDIPLRHGLTLAEGCLYGAWRAGLITAPPQAWRSFGQAGAQGMAASEWLHVVPLEGWRGELYFDETGLPWTIPSPNMPTLDTAIVYPGQVMLEGTNLSEGRGTTRPFEIFGAPYLDPPVLAEQLVSRGWVTEGATSWRLAGTLHGSPSSPLAGAHLREVSYEPTFHRYAGEMVRGFQIHVVDRPAFRPVSFTVALLDAIRRTHPAFAWRQPPYEYEQERLPIDLICGSDSVRRSLDAGPSAEELIRGWEPGLAAFRERVHPLLLYRED